LVEVAGFAQINLPLPQAVLTSAVQRLKDSLAHDLNQLVRIASRNVAGFGRQQHAGDYLAVTAANLYFISRFDGMR
jgi:hypothetical protein